MLSKPTALLLLPHLRVQNANAIAGALSWGFPAPSAFLGFSHALERRLAARFGVQCLGVGVVCHEFSPQTSRPNRRSHQTLHLYRNNVFLKRDAGKFINEGTPPAIVEEGRVHLAVSLVIPLCGGQLVDSADEAAFLAAVEAEVFAMRLAGGSILPPLKPQPRHRATYLPWAETSQGQSEIFSQLKRSLLPGFALIHRPDVLQTAQTKLSEAGQAATAIDALLACLRLKIAPVPQGEETGKGKDDAAAKKVWQVQREVPEGWLVPVPVGYAAISEIYPAGKVANSRDPNVPFAFVEPLYSVGQWQSPHRLRTLADLIWYSEADTEHGLYRCRNDYAAQETVVYED